MLQRAAAKPEVKLPPPPDTEGGELERRPAEPMGSARVGSIPASPPPHPIFGVEVGSGRLRRRPAKPMGSARVGSIPASPPPRPIFGVGVGAGG